MPHLVYGPGFGRSAKLLAASAGLQPIRIGSRFQPRELPILSWGTRSATQSLNGQICVNKLSQLKLWTDASLKTLTFALTPQPNYLPRTGTSYGGKDFDGRRILTPRYWTKPLQSDAEYRVHLFRAKGKPRGSPSSYKVIRFGYKVNESPSLNREVCGIPIRSRQFGWKIKYFGQERIQRNLPSDLSLLARWAIATIGWDFGAIDVLHVGDQWVLLEANSCPGLLDENTAKAYADAVKEHM